MPEPCVCVKTRKKGFPCNTFDSSNTGRRKKAIPHQMTETKTKKQLWCPEKHGAWLGSKAIHTADGPALLSKSAFEKTRQRERSLLAVPVPTPKHTHEKKKRGGDSQLRKQHKLPHAGISREAAEHDQAHHNSFSHLGRPRAGAGVLRFIISHLPRFIVSLLQYSHPTSKYHPPLTYFNWSWAI